MAASKQEQDLNRRLLEIEARISKMGKGSKEVFSGLSNVFDKISESSKKIEDHMNNVKNLSREELQTLRDQLTLNRKAAEAYVSNLQNAKRLTKEQKDLRDLYEQQLQGIDQQQQAVEKLIQTAKKRAEEEKGIAGFLTKQTNEFQKQIKSQVQSIANTLTIGKGLKFVYEAATDLSSRISETSKNLGLSYNASKAMTMQIRSMAAGMRDVTFKEAVAGNIQLNEQFGTSIIFSKDMVDQNQKVQDLIGLSADEAGKLAGMSALTGKNQNEVVKSITKQNKGILSNKAVLKDVLKIEGQLAAQYKNDPVLLAKAVVQAKQLGMTLEQTKNTSSQLLDFESSIANELEAELLTGMDLNLEKARYLALQGDSAGAAKELMNNLGPNGLAKFQKMNVIQQEALARSLGMSADELSNSLVKQKQLDTLKSKGALNEIQRLKEKGDVESLAKAEALEKAVLSGEELSTAKQKYDIETQARKNTEKALDALRSMIASPAMTMIGSLLEKVSELLTNKTVQKILGVAGFLAAGISIVGAVTSLAGMAKNFFSPRPSGRAGDPIEVTMQGGGGGGGSSSGPGGGRKGFGGGSRSFGSYGKDMFKGGRAGKVARARLGKGLNPMKALSKGNLLAAAAGMGIDYAGNKLMESELEHLEAAQRESDPKKRQEHLDKAKSMGNWGKAANIGGKALEYGSYGAMIGSIIPGLGTAVGAGAGALLGAGLGAWESFFGDSDEAEDFIIRPGQKPLKFRKDDVLIGGTDPLGTKNKQSGLAGSDQVVRLLTELVAAVKAGRDIYLDGVKVGTALKSGRAGYSLQ
jgi:hypothetical protein